MREKKKKTIFCVALCALLLALCSLLLAPCFTAQAQQQGKVYRIGYLGAGSPKDIVIEGFRQGLRELNYIEGKNIAIEPRFSAGKLDRLSDLAAEFVRLKVDVIVTGGPTATRAAKGTSNTIPIVMMAVGDPVGAGFVASLARPGGNITGLSNLSSELSGKRIEFLKEAIPKAVRVAVLFNRASNSQSFKETELVATALRLKLQPLHVRDSNEIDDAFEAAVRGRSGALLLLRNAITSGHQKKIVDLAAKHRLPAMYEEREWVEIGGLMSYGPDLKDQGRRAAVYVDKILKGAKPAELPVEQPKKFEFIVNLNAAKRIGLTIPPNVLARADRVIR